MIDDSKYLEKVHKKIKYKKIRDNLIGAIGSLAICFYIIVFQPIKEDFLFDNFFDSLTFYEWEIESGVSNDEMFYYLLDNTCIEEYENLLNEDIIEVIEKINLGG
tara:strand:+ start:168 stop:482 length:315 start_codon:yes stop_codon:yes gene_type:complete